MVLKTRAWGWEAAPFYPFPSNTLFTSKDDDIHPRSIGPRRVGTQIDGSSLARNVWVTGV